MQGHPYRAHRAPLLVLVVVCLLAACSGPTAQPPAAPAPAAPAAGAATSAPSAAPAPAAGAPPATAGPARPFDLGVVAFVSYFYPMWIAAEKGFGAQQGLDIQLTTLQTNEAVAAAVSGSLDVLMCPTDACVTAVAKGAQMKMVNDYLTQAPYNLMARPEIQSFADLRDKKIGVSSLTTGSGSLARIMLSSQGLQPADYTLVQAGGNPQRYAALQSGGVDAAMLSDPANFEAMIEGYRDLMDFSKVVPQYSFASDWVTNDWLSQGDHPDVLVRFQVAQAAASRWAQDPANKQALIDLIVDKTKASQAVAERIYNFYIVTDPGIMGVDDLRTEPVDSVVRILQDEGTITDMPPASQWRDPTYIQRARQLLAR